MTALIGQDVSPAELDELDELAGSIDDNVRDQRLLARRIRRLRAGRAKGRSWKDLLADEPLPGTLTLASDVLSRVTWASGSLRRMLAAGLRAHGESIGAIAKRFGVSHQRVSTLLRRADN